MTGTSKSTRRNERRIIIGPFVRFFSRSIQLHVGLSFRFGRKSIQTSHNTRRKQFSKIQIPTNILRFIFDFDLIDSPLEWNTSKLGCSTHVESIQCFKYFIAIRISRSQTKHSTSRCSKVNFFSLFSYFLSSWKKTTLRFSPLNKDCSMMNDDNWTSMHDQQQHAEFVIHSTTMIK